MEGMNFKSSSQTQAPSSPASHEAYSLRATPNDDGFRPGLRRISGVEKHTSAGGDSGFNEARDLLACAMIRGLPRRSTERITRSGKVRFSAISCGERSCKTPQCRSLDS